MKMKYFKSIKGTDFDKEVNKYVKNDKKWLDVLNWISARLDEPELLEIYMSTNNLGLNTSELKKEENKKLFKKNGFLKSNSNTAKSLLREYKNKLEELGLHDFMSLRDIFFTYGLVRMHGESLRRYKDEDNVIYIETNAYWSEKGRSFLEEITELEYNEQYLKLLKKKGENNA